MLYAWLVVDTIQKSQDGDGGRQGSDNGCYDNVKPGLAGICKDKRKE